MFTTILAIVFLVIALMCNIVSKSEPYKGKDDKAFKFISILLFVLSPILLLIACITIIPSGSVGVQSTFGKINQSTLSPGVNFVVPWVNVEDVSIKTQSYTMVSAHGEGKVEGNDAMDVLTKDGISLDVELSVIYHVMPEKAANLLTLVGSNYEDIVVRPFSRSIIRDAFVASTTEEAYSTKRAEIKKFMIVHIGAEFAKKGLYVEDVLIRSVKLPKSITNAVEKKNTALLESQSMDYTIEREKKEAERKRVEAAGVRDYQQIITQNASELTVKLKTLETMEKLSSSPNAKFYFFGDKTGSNTLLPQ